MQKKIRVIELFAGVGGFRLGMEGFNGKSSSSGYSEEFNSPFKVIWANQWEPNRKNQDAADIYNKNFEDNHLINEDINKVDIGTIPEHDVMVGGFPCQDYSVANVGDNAKGIVGKNGVLWWSIHKILSTMKVKPGYLIFENVDRLLKSPTKQRGRDFAMILQSLVEVGYSIEWRTIKASDYGMPQRRNRLYMVARKNEINAINDVDTWETHSTLNKSFPSLIDRKSIRSFDLGNNSFLIFSEFNKGMKDSPFLNSGFVAGSKVTTFKVTPAYEGIQTTMADILVNDADESFFIDDMELPKWRYLKGGKSEKRRKKDGFEYNYTEGPIAFPDSLDRPSRTIITSEGGSTASRFKHVIEDKGRYRRLTPKELERLNMFPDDFTLINKISDTRRAFFMGNALVVGVIEKISRILADEIIN